MDPLLSIPILIILTAINAFFAAAEIAVISLSETKLKKQAEEEMEHAHKMIDYAIDRGADVNIAQIDAVPTTWENPIAAFENVYNHECKVSAMIDDMMNIAEADKDHATRDFLFWFVREQVEEESTAKKILDDLNRYGECHIAIVDHELGKR